MLSYGGLKNLGEIVNRWHFKNEMHLARRSLKELNEGKITATPKPG